MHPFLDLGDMPIANAFLREAQLREKEYTFHLQAAFCEACLMAQLVETVDPKALFHENYAYFSSISKVMDEHFAGLATLIGDTLLYSDELPVLEIGCNDGILLGKLAQRAPKAIGIEPSSNVAEAARGKGLAVIDEFFTPALAAQLANQYGRAQVVVGGNVLCHIPDLNGLARALDSVLDGDGVFIFEDPYLLEIMTNLAYDQIYDEHVYYFSVSSLIRFFERRGFRVFRVEPIPVHGGSMRVFGCRRDSHRPAEPSVGIQIEREQEAGLGEIESYKSFAGRVERSRESLLDLLRTLKAGGKRLVGYAASSKGTVVLNYCAVGPDLLDYICDNTPTKQGLYTPGTHIPIVSTDAFRKDNPDYTFVLAWNHLREIVQKESAFTARGGRFITHVPTARIVANADA